MLKTSPAVQTTGHAPLMMIVAAAKLVADRLGVLAAYHRWRNRRTLTVLMFHRVLPPADCAQADPTWTVTTPLFDEILGFLERHYNLVSLDDVESARIGRKPLPSRAMLITFDDGWRDNLDHALPALRRRRAPGTVFVANDAIEDGRPCWWQEVLLWALRTGRRNAADFCREAGLSDASGEEATAPELRLLLHYAARDAGERDALLQPLARELGQLQEHRQMLDPEALRELAAAGIAVGVHGAAHVPLTELADPAEDLATARRRLAAYSGQDLARALSFPHGRYDARVVAAARQLGFTLQFTSDAIVNASPRGLLRTDLIGRIPLFAHQIRRADGSLARERLATSLFLRPVRELTCIVAARG